MCSTTEAIGRATAALADLHGAETGPGSSTAADYLALRRLIEQLEVVGLRWLATLDSSGVGTTDGSASTAAWVRRHTGCSARAASADVRLSRRLHTDDVRRLATTSELLDEGLLTVEHARVIARATATLASDAFETAEPLVAKTAVDLPVDAAGQVATAVCRHAEELHANDQVDPAAARRAAAEASRHLHLSPCGEMYALDALLTAEAGQALQAVLAPLSLPRPQTDPAPDLRTARQRRADALGEAARMLLASDRLPTHGGQRPQLTVLIDLEDLAGRRGGWFPDGTVLSAAATERMSCDARVDWIATRSSTVPDADGQDDGAVVRAALRRISPALGGLPTEILDAGRAQRLVSPGQRHALAVRDRGCIFPGCDRPPEWCDAHHLRPWSEGGPSDLKNLGLLCARHHTAVHEDGWTLSRAPDGTVSVTPPWTGRREQHPPRFLTGDDRRAGPACTSGPPYGRIGR